MVNCEFHGRWWGCGGCVGSLIKMQGEKQMVKWKARLRVKASFEAKSKAMKGKVVPCRVLLPDDWIVRVVGVLRWG